VKSQLEEVGFEVTLDVMDWNQLLDVGRAGREQFPEIDGINISRAIQDPFSAMFRFALTSQAAPAGNNWGHYSNPEFDALIDEIYSTFDPEARDALVVEAHEKFVDEALFLFVAHDINPRALAPNLSGFVQAQSWFQDLTPIVVE
jgi:peptide/nickel transport system substrate-binding protein